MGDWNTLHLFDSKKFYNEITPDLKDKGELFDIHFQSKLYWYRTRIDQTDTEILKKVKILVKNLDSSLRFHKELYEIDSRKYSYNSSESEREFIIGREHDSEAFQKEHGYAIYHYIELLLLTVFSECAQFNPHFRLGRRIFTGNISATKGSIADECYDYIAYQSVGGVGYHETGHIINWLTHEDAQLLWLDIDNIGPRDEESEEYFNAFKNFLQIAVENELGFISVSNVSEKILNMIESPKLNIEIDIKNGFFGQLIEYK